MAGSHYARADKERNEFMKRAEILKRLGFTVPSENKIRMIVDTDAANEADDQFAIMHHLLTPTFDIRGIIAAHFEQKISYAGGSMEQSYAEIKKVLQLAGIDDIAAYRGCEAPLASLQDAPGNEGVDMIIEEAMKEDDRPLYIAVQGAATNVAAALNKAPEIAEQMTVLWNGGGSYPDGGWEFNLLQDINACRVLLKSSVCIWQSNIDVYSRYEISMAELAMRIRPCGRIGAYLFEQLLEENEIEYNLPLPEFRRGENWALGDNTTIAMLMENQATGHWYMRKAPKINDDMTYTEDPDGKEIKVFTDLDYRMSLEDLYAKMALVYKDALS